MAAPTWLTFVPSSKHPDLVPRFAAALAEQLGLPMHEALAQIRDNRLQKEMENAFHRCRNLAVVSAILKREGAGPMFPFAIMNTAAG